MAQIFGLRLIWFNFKLLNSLNKNFNREIKFTLCCRKVDDEAAVKFIIYSQKVVAPFKKSFFVADTI